MNKDTEAGRDLLWSKRATYMDTTDLFTDKHPTEELTTFYESEDKPEARAAADFWQNSWTAG